MTTTKRMATLCAALCALTLGASRPAAAQSSVLGGAAGGAGGLVAGTTITLGLIVANARMERDFIHGPEDIISLQGVPIPLGIAAGIWLGADDPARAEEIGALAGAGMVLGSGLGALIGEAVTQDDPSGKWAGGVMGAAAGVVIGILVGSL